MDEVPQGTPVPVRPERPILQTIFLRDQELRAGWRLLIYVFLVAAFGYVSGRLVPSWLRLNPDHISAGLFYFQESRALVIVSLPAFLMSRLEGRPFGSYGLPAGGAFGKLFWLGALAGLIEVSALVGSIAALGGYAFGPLAIHGAGILRWALVWAFFFVLVGLFEEFLFRGYTQFTLADGIGFWPAAVLLSVGFGLVHLGNSGESYVGAASVVVVGMFLAFTLKRTGSLWFAVGLHASFDFGETFLFSVPNSGMSFPGHLSDAALAGPLWLTGGSVGPEGSVFSFLTIGALAVAVHFVFPAKPPLSGSAHQL